MNICVSKTFIKIFISDIEHPSRGPGVIISVKQYFCRKVFVKVRRVQTSDVIDFEVIGVARIVAGPEEKVDVGGNVTRDDGGVSADQEDTLVLKFNKMLFHLQIHLRSC